MSGETALSNASGKGGDYFGWRVMITGGSSGIGLATGIRFIERGAKVVSLDLKRPYDEKRIAWQYCDVADDSSVRAAVAAAVKSLDGLDVLVNSAGIGMQGSIDEEPDVAEVLWRRLLEVNVLGVMRVTRAALPALRLSSRASIVNIASFVALAGVPRRAAYGASKGAVFALTKALAADHLHEGVRVNSVSPGTVDTPWIDRLMDAAGDPGAERAAVMARQPHGRLVAPEEVAAAVCFLAGPDSGSTTGVDLVVDGGILGTRIPTSTRAPSQS